MHVPAQAKGEKQRVRERATNDATETKNKDQLKSGKEELKDR